MTYHHKEIKKGVIFYYDENNFYHREDGPSIECDTTYKAWFIHGERHREDGPAIINDNSNMAWYIRGELHREDGPAIENHDGYKAWYKHGKLIYELKTYFKII